MKFANLHYLWFLTIIPLLVVFYIWAFRKKKKLIELFVSEELKDRLLQGFSPRRQKLKATLLIIAVFFSILALIRPKWGFHWEEVSRRGVDIIVALDVSESMLAKDVSPNRLERAKREIIDLLNMMQGDRIGLVAFAGTSFLQSPLTLDYGAVRIFLDELDTDLIPVPGTAIGEAIKKSTEAFDTKNKKSRVLILITDGEDHLGAPLEMAKKASEAGIKIYTIGIGKLEGAPIPDRRRGGFKKDSNGNVVLTQLDESTLQKMALNTGGSYVRSITGDLDLEKIYKDITKKVEAKELVSGKRKRFEERFQWPLMMALLILILEVFVKERKKQKTILGPMAILCLFLGTTNPLKAAPWDSKRKTAEEQYEKKNYNGALKDFLEAQVSEPKDLELKYNTANSYYKMKDFEKAHKLFESTAKKGDKDLSARSYYNLGNTSYRMGRLKEAVDFYKKTLELKPKDKDAQFNLDFVRKEIKRRIEQQKKRQQQQKKQSKSGQKQKNQQDGKEQKNQKSAQNQKGQQKEQQKSTAGKDKKEKKPQEGQEKKKTAQGKKDQKKKEDEVKTQASSRGKPGKNKKKMNEAEALRWLNSLSDERKKYLKRKMRGRRSYQVEKDW
ncbi:MAG: VWA domain-containing protein [Bdellovibrionota bacterium]|nr:VWA domain-containing protein [Bdellovibrionota bacterium]